MIARILVFLACFLAPAVYGQAVPPSSNANVPTTKILAIGHIIGGSEGPNRQQIMPNEVRETVKLYLAGKIDSWYVRKDTAGVVFLMNVTTVAEAHQLLESLPLGKAKMMEFELIPIGPLSPLQYLLAEPQKP
jgi:hypothetical protein